MSPQDPEFRVDVFNAQIAQLVEHTLGKGEVGSSNLLLGSIINEQRAPTRANYL